MSLAFLIRHIYLATTGPTPVALLRAMVTRDAANPVETLPDLETTTNQAEPVA
jgi:hypothetical protein